MNMFGKHIFRSIKKEPAQPIMIIIIVTICVAVMILAVTLPVNIYMNESGRNRIDEWTADMHVTLKSTSNVRLLFDDDINSILGDKGRAIGEFALQGFSDLRDTDGNVSSRMISLGAFDLLEADRFYEIRYLEYGKFTNNNLDTAAIIDEKFANEYNLSIGDTISINILGYSFEYTVQAIAMETGVFNTRNMIVDISSVRRVLSERSPLIASLSSEFNPYTAVHIKANEGVNIEELKSELESRAEFADKKVELATNDARKNYFTTVLTVTILIPAILLATVAAMMMISTFELLQKKRHLDVALFKIIGADTSHLNMLLYLESMIYGLIGGVFGTVLFIPITEYINELYQFEYSRLSFGLSEIFIGLGSSMLFVVLCTFLHIRRQKKKNLQAELSEGNFDTEHSFSYRKLLYAIPAALMLVIALLTPVKYRYISSFLLMFALVLFIYVISPYIIGWFASFVSWVLSKKRYGAGNYIIAAKSCRNSYPLRHAGRIMTILITLFASLTFVLSAVENQLVSYTSLTAFDYIGIYADDQTKEMISNLDAVVAPADSTVERNVEFADGSSAAGIAISGDREECFNKILIPDNMPKGDTIALSKGVARKLGLKVGDQVECVIAGLPCKLTLVEIVNTYADFAFYDAEHLGIPMEMFCILTDGTEDATEKVIALLDERGVECLGQDDFFADTYKMLNPQVQLFNVMFYIMIFMTIVGIFNILSDQRLARLNEFEIIKQNGNTSKQIIALQALEAAYLFVCAFAASVVLSGLICLILDMAAASFGMTLYV